MTGPEIASFGVELAQAEMKGRRLVGYASVFNYPIDSGTTSTPQKTFVRPGFFDRTLEKNWDQIQVLYHHGQDPQVGTVPLGRPEVMKPDKTGLWTETPLAKTRFNEETLIPLLESQALRSMSIQFVTEQQSFNDDRSERYLEQGRLYEFGPTPFPANEGSTAALHSLHSFLAMGTEFHWDGAAALRTCSNAAEFRKISFERANDSDPDTAAHWALPHHPHWRGAPGNADSQGVGAALAALHGGRGGAPDLVASVATVEAHLQAHQSSSSSSRDPSLEAARVILAMRLAEDEWMEGRWRALES
ncbi:MAG: HK97 family phage prohead protease [bacterium]